jgi:hypothetical protein
MWMHRVIFGVLLACLAASLPVWPYSRGWDFSLSGRIAVVLAVFIVLKITKWI